jgi:hypothetical protein
MEFMSKNEKAVSVFIEGKTMDEVKQAIRDLAESAWNASYRHIQDALSVESGDFASYILGGEKFNFSKEMQIAWLEYYASREIKETLEAWDCCDASIEQMKHAREVCEVISFAFPCPQD